jgi:hypothetical protein
MSLNPVREFRVWRELREHLLLTYPELAQDEQTLVDTLSGECDLLEALGDVIRRADEDRMLVEALEARMAEMRARKERIEQRIERRREFVADAMEQAGVKKFAIPEATITLTPRPPKTMVTDAAALPDEFWTQPPLPDPVVNKKLLAERLKAGEPIPGACLSNPRSTITIRRS